MIIPSKEISPKLGLRVKSAGNSNRVRMKLNLEQLTCGGKLFMKQLT